MSTRKLQFRVRVNAEQLSLTGAAVMWHDTNVVIVEGGPKNMKKFKRLMLHRITWPKKGSKPEAKDEEAEQEDEEEEEDSDDEEQVRYLERSLCASLGGPCY